MLHQRYFGIIDLQVRVLRAEKVEEVPALDAIYCGSTTLSKLVLLFIYRILYFRRALS